MWRLCGVIIKIHFSDPQLNFGSVLEIHFLFIFEIQIYRILTLEIISRSYGPNWSICEENRPEVHDSNQGRSELRFP